MMETISINGLTLCHKHSTGFTRSTLMDMCRTPTAPVPYVNTAFARDLADGTTTVLSHRGAMNGVKGSMFAVSYGDEPGRGLGVKSNTVQAEATWLSWSPNVFMEKRAVTRLTDKMLMNHGNTISAGGYYTGPVTGKEGELLDKICEFACECKAAGTFSQNCIDGKLEDWAKANGRDITPNGAYEKGSDGKWKQRLNANGEQAKGGGAGTRRPDYTDHDTGTIGEVKLPRDRYRGSQNQAYDQIAKDTGQDRHDINFAQDCDCDPGDDDPHPNPQPNPKPTSPKEDEEPNDRSWLEDNKGWLEPVGIGVGVVAVAAVAVFAGPEIAAVAGISAALSWAFG